MHSNKDYRDMRIKEFCLGNLYYGEVHMTEYESATLSFENGIVVISRPCKDDLSKNIHS